MPKLIIEVKDLRGNIGSVKNEESMIVEKRAIDGKLNHFLAFAYTKIPPGCIHTLVTVPQVPFRPRRLVVAPECMKDILIQDMKIGKNSYMLSWAQDGKGLQGVPASLFPPIPSDLSDSEKEAFEALLSLKLPLLEVSQMASIQIMNTSKEPRFFGGALWGEMI